MQMPSFTPPEKTTPNHPPVDVYKRISATTGYQFFAICYPSDGTRAVTVFDDTEAGCLSRMNALLSI